MRVIYDKTTGRVLAVGDAVEPGEGQASADLTPDESTALLTTRQEAVQAAEAARTAQRAAEEAQGRYNDAASQQRQAFAAAEREATKAGGVVGFDPQRGFVTLAAQPKREPTAEEDAARLAALAASDSDLALLARLLLHQANGGRITAATAGRKG